MLLGLMAWKKGNELKLNRNVEMTTKIQDTRIPFVPVLCKYKMYRHLEFGIEKNIKTKFTNGDKDWEKRMLRLD